MARGETSSSIHFKLANEILQRLRLSPQLLGARREFHDRGAELSLDLPEDLPPAVADAARREVRGSGKVIGTDRIAVMVALNLAHELLQEKSEQDSAVSSASKRIRSLRERIEIALNDSTQLEL